VARFCGRRHGLLEAPVAAASDRRKFAAEVRRRGRPISPAALRRETRQPAHRQRSLARPGKVAGPARTTSPPPVPLEAGAPVEHEPHLDTVGQQPLLDAPPQPPKIC
jgi:hypothetical protein